MAAAAASSEGVDVSRRLGGGYTRGTAVSDSNDRIVFSGGACLKARTKVELLKCVQPAVPYSNHFFQANSECESNQIYEYVPNCQVFLLQSSPQSPSGWEWQPLLDLSYFASKFRAADYSVISVFPADVTLTRLKVRRDPHAASKFKVKYLNINFPSGSSGSGEQ